MSDYIVTSCWHCHNAIYLDGSVWLHAADSYALCDAPLQTAAEPEPLP
jgi:hypothetical protein